MPSMAVLHVPQRTHQQDLCFDSTLLQWSESTCVLLATVCPGSSQDYRLLSIVPMYFEQCTRQLHASASFLPYTVNDHEVPRKAHDHLPLAMHINKAQPPAHQHSHEQHELSCAMMPPHRKHVADCHMQCHATIDTCTRAQESFV